MCLLSLLLLTFIIFEIEREKEKREKVGPLPVSAIDSTDSCTLMIHYIARGLFAPLDEAIAGLMPRLMLLARRRSFLLLIPMPLPQRHDKMDSLLSYTFSYATSSSTVSYIYIYIIHIVATVARRSNDNFD